MYRGRGAVVHDFARELGTETIERQRVAGSAEDGAHDDISADDARVLGGFVRLVGDLDLTQLSFAGRDVAPRHAPRIGVDDAVRAIWLTRDRKGSRVGSA